MSEQQQGTTVLDPPARRNGPGKTYEYKLYMDGENVARVGEWEAEQVSTTYFCHYSEGDERYPAGRYPDCIDGDDLRHVATVEAANADAAGELLLRGDVALNERGKVVRAAYEAHVGVVFTALTPGKITLVPKLWEQRWIPV